LEIYCYGIGALSSEFKIDSHVELKKYLASWGFKNSEDTALCKNIQAVEKFYNDVLKKREKLAFDIDGIVVKVNSRQLQEELGFVQRAPRSMLAYKYPARQETSIVENIILQVGRTGAITPVAILKPVNVGGVMVTRVTLHNPQELDRKDVRLGDTVVVQRAGDVIPEIVKVVLESRPKNTQKYIFPKYLQTKNAKLLLFVSIMSGLLMLCRPISFFIPFFFAVFMLYAFRAEKLNPTDWISAFLRPNFSVVVSAGQKVLAIR
jgi:DNA ligase (NAD+)